VNNRNKAVQVSTCLGFATSFMNVIPANHRLINALHSSDFPEQA